MAEADYCLLGGVDDFRGDCDLYGEDHSQEFVYTVNEGGMGRGHMNFGSGETTGFGDFGGDMEPAKEETLPFGMPEEDSEMSMGPERMAPFGQEVEDGAVEPLGQGMSPGDMEPESGEVKGLEI